MILSNNGRARLTMLSCPTVNGSNDPGKMAIRSIVLLLLNYLSRKYNAYSKTASKPTGLIRFGRTLTAEKKD